MLRIPLARASLLVAMTVLGPKLATAAPRALDCSPLAGSTIERSLIALPTGGALVESAELADDGSGKRFCRVLGAILPVMASAPSIRFQVNLPVDWNGKVLHMGGGAYNGFLVTGESGSLSEGSPTPLRQGYVTFGSDSGHQAQAVRELQSMGTDLAAFALNPEAKKNFAGDQLKKTHDVALVLVERGYGQSPRRVYFQGGSQGGGEALKVVQRWPRDYDGVIAIHPVYDFAAIQTGGVLAGQIVYGTPAAWVSPAKGAMVRQKVMAACDRLDGLEDGIIGNVRACRRTFDTAALRCPDGGDNGPQCLSDAQLEAVRKLSSSLPLGVTFAGGVKAYGRWPLLEGGALDGRFNPFGLVAGRPRPPGPTNSFHHFFGDQMVRYMLLGNPSYDSLGFVPSEHAAALRAFSAEFDASSDDIRAFRDRGGKLLLFHGTVDMAVSPYNTIAYWDRLKGRFGAAGLDRFARFYLLPGFGHGEGPFQPSWNSLATLDAWVDRGERPALQLVVDTAATTRGRSRPLCEYPAYPRYTGTGDPKAAASFSCTLP